MLDFVDHEAEMVLSLQQRGAYPSGRLTSDILGIGFTGFCNSKGILDGQMVSSLTELTDVGEVCKIF